MTRYKIGIDVGSTHTDAVIIDEQNNVIVAEKTVTTPDVTSGIINSLNMVLAKFEGSRDEIEAVMFGTTHVINAIVQRKGLGRVGVIRIGRPATLAIEPMLDWPSDLRDAINGGVAIVPGGHEYTGEEISGLDEDAVRKALKAFTENNVHLVAVTSVFSVVNPSHELRVKEIAEEIGTNIQVVMSHEIATVGLLERENATILNAATIPVIKKAAQSLRRALESLGLSHAKMYFAQNDGTTAYGPFIEKFPIFTVVAPISNSIRGAFVLTQIRNAIVADTGGTTTNIGALVNGYPRESLEVEIGGVKTNIRAPDVIALGLGGGTIIADKSSSIAIGPVSVGYRLTEDGVCWGGRTLTATDVAVALGYMKIDDDRCDRARVLSAYEKGFLEKAYGKMLDMLIDGLDRIKTSPKPETIILVGGGSLMWPKSLPVASEVIRPEYAQYANALGAATALVGATAEKAFSYEAVSRSSAIQQTIDEAKRKAIEAGASPATLEVAEVEEIAMPYLPGNAVKIRAKVIGKLG